MEQRITELESQLAFQEHTVASLNEIVTRQQGQIDLLQEQLRHLATQIKQVADSMNRPSQDEPPPPHY